MSVEKFLQAGVRFAVEQLYGTAVADEQIQIQITNRDFDGDYTFVVFPAVARECEIFILNSAVQTVQPKFSREFYI